MRKIHILIAEDDPLCAEDLENRLAMLDYQVVAKTENAQEAVVLAQRIKPDLALIDIQLPGEMDGIQAAKQIMAQQVPAMFVTGYCEGPIFERAKLVEPYGYVLKPYQTRDLKTAIEMGLHRFEVERERKALMTRLQEAVNQVKTLSGLLSICGYCKKIKDDEGNWDQLEAYLMKRTAASFSHGMCPDCFNQVKRNLESLEHNIVMPGAMIVG